MPMQRLNHDQLHVFLPRLLAGPDERRAAAQVVSNFEAFLHQTAVGWVAFSTSAEPSGFVALSLILPGKVGFVLCTQPEQGRDANVAVVRTTYETALREHPQHYAQSLIEVDAVGKRDLLQAAGFARLTTLNYLERRVVYPWVDAPPPTLAWEIFTDATRERFADLISASYVDSADCPELVGKRPLEDVIAAHQAGGLHDPTLWLLGRQDGRDVGCALINPQHDGSVAELVYLGVAPQARRQGIGRLLLQKTLAACRDRRFEQLLVVVDERNIAARGLYEAFDFRLNTQREAWLRYPNL